MFRDAHEELRKLHDVGMMGISRDSVETHERFRAEHRLTFPLISDADGSISKRFGVARLWGWIRFVKRVTFVVDPAGVIRGVFHHEMAIERHLREVRACLEAMRP